MSDAVGERLKTSRRQLSAPAPQAASFRTSRFKAALKDSVRALWALAPSAAIHRGAPTLQDNEAWTDRLGWRVIWVVGWIVPQKGPNSVREQGQVPTRIRRRSGLTRTPAP